MKPVSALILLLISITMLFASYAAAQEDNFTPEELEAIEFVAAAYENLMQQSSIEVAGATSIMQDMSFGEGVNEMKVQMSIEQEMEGVYAIAEDGTISSEMSLTQNMQTRMPGQPNTEIDMVMEMVALEEGLYIRVSGIEDSILADMYPEGWVNVTENPEDMSTLTTLLNVDVYTEMLGNQWAFDITPETIETIEELESQTLRGQTLRLFDITYNTEALLESEQFQQAAGMVNLQSLGVDFESILEDMFAGMVFSIRIGVGADDQLIYTMEMTMTTEGELSGDFTQGVTILFQQEMYAEMDYFNYNEPVSITAPEEE